MDTSRYYYGLPYNSKAPPPVDITSIATAQSLRTCAKCRTANPKSFFVSASCGHDTVCLMCFRVWLSESLKIDCFVCKHDFSAGEVIGALCTREMPESGDQYTAYTSYATLPASIIADLSATFTLDSPLEVIKFDDFQDGYAVVGGTWPYGRGMEPFTLDIGEVFKMCKDKGTAMPPTVRMQQESMLWQIFFGNNALAFTSLETARRLSHGPTPHWYKLVKEVHIATIVAKDHDEACKLIINKLSRDPPPDLRRVLVSAECMDEWLRMNHRCNTPFLQSLPDLIERLVLRLAKLIVAIDKKGSWTRIEWDPTGPRDIWICDCDPNQPSPGTHRRETCS
ncbi:hypothetical protein BU16DRAFT_532504 [Lophium mytilinum]|uniref:RING-type domain-containing protein n=1 Tax=Lophium mytilinum TaxID=390894 RepID=A0A6A6RED9_9PEZI|nr:hypothetical protein BU16DRAFT_532504 [Lophium mytilinum]